MGVYPEIFFEIKIGSTWEDISADVIQDSTCFYGISGNSPTDRVSDVGSLEFVLRNDSGCLGGVENYYTPLSAYTKTGWQKGVPVRLKITYLLDSVVKFYGHISEIKVNPVSKTVNVTALDYMDYLTNYPLNLTTIATNKEISGIVQTILSGMTIQPQATSYATGTDTYSVAFDTVNENTRAISEMNKVALSELGYVYIKRDSTYGETLVVEGRHSRNYTSTLSQLPRYDEYLLNQDGTNLLWEDSTKILLNTYENNSFSSDMVSIGLTYGRNIFNKVTVKSYPRKTDTSVSVLFSLNNPISISAGETLANYVGYYRDPSGGNSKISGSGMLTPVATTDYLMYEYSDGTGANLTSYLTVTANYGINGVTYTLQNTGTKTGYITKLQARGKGVYIYDSVSYTTNDTTSLNAYGYQELSIDQKYQQNPLVSQNMADALLSQYKDPASNFESVEFIANTDDWLMRSFLYLDIGSLIYVVDDLISPVISSDEGFYYINSIDFKIKQGGLVAFSYGLVPAFNIGTTYWLLDTSTLDTSTILGY